MQTNGINGGHQHEVSEKRVNPGAFPCRLDMELCACGAKRWVDLKGRPATPWQFINFRRGREETESAAVTIGSTPISALDGLITCGSCGQPMALDDTQGGQEALYACEPGPGQSRCPTPRLHARSAEVLLIGKVLQTVLTEENISRVLAVANDPQRHDEAREHRLTRQDLQKVREIPERFVLTAESREFLGRFITEIQVHAGKGGRPLLHPAAGRQPSGGHAPAGNRPAGGGARLKETVEQPQQANEDGGHSIRHPGQRTTQSPRPLGPHRASAELSGTTESKSSSASRPPNAAARAPRDRRKPVLFHSIRVGRKNGETIRRAHRLHRTPDRRRRHVHPQQCRGLEEPAHQHSRNSMALLTRTTGSRQGPGAHKRRGIRDGHLRFLRGRT